MAVEKQLVGLSMVGADWLVKTYLDGDGTYALEIHSPDFTSLSEADNAVEALKSMLRQRVNG